MQNPFFSIIIPAYNTEEYLLECLLSIKNQTFVDFEAIVINDGSPNKNEHFQDIQTIFDQIQDKRFRLITQENSGVSVARNNGLDNANGEFVHFVDSDDWLGLNHLGDIYKELKKHNFDKTTVFYQADSNPFKIENNQFVPLPQHRPVIQQRAKNNNFTKELVFFSIPEAMMLVSRSLIGSCRLKKGLQMGEGPRFIADIYLSNPKISFEQLEVRDSYMYRHSELSNSKSEDSETREVQNYSQIYSFLLAQKISILQRVVCQLAIWRYKLILIKNPAAKIFRKILTLVSKIITNWYF